MDRDYTEVAEYLKDETVIVIGGGPSLLDFDFDSISSCNRIGANDAGRLSGAEVIVTLDRNYYRNRMKELVEEARKGRMVYVALPDHMPNVDFPPEIAHLRFKRGRGLSQSPDMLYGLNSGFAALNLAFLAGAKDIRLIGFDFKFSADQPHWHEEHPWFRQKNDQQIRKWAKDFDNTVAQLETHGVEVTNYVGPGGSEITAYPTRPLEDLLK